MGLVALGVVSLMHPSLQSFATTVASVAPDWYNAGHYPGQRQVYTWGYGEHGQVHHDILYSLTTFCSLICLFAAPVGAPSGEGRGVP